MSRRDRNRKGGHRLKQRQRAKSSPPSKSEHIHTAFLCEADVVPGLEAVAYQEIQRRLGGNLHLRHSLEDAALFGALRFLYTGPLHALLRLRTVFAVYLVCPFDISRPRALLGHEHFHRLFGQIETVLQLSPANTFTTLYLDAAGSDSPTMTRLKDALADRLGLRVDPHDGDLVLRVRRPRFAREGWEVLIRLSPRPLSVRSWRVCDRKGALNAAVARAMVLLTKPHPEDIFLNVACGSGTLAIERLDQSPASRVLGCDTAPEALHCARMNGAASGPGEQIELYQWDARALPIPDQSVDVICADLPFGNVIGSHEENVDLYPALLKEGARVAKPGARACLLTHEVKLMERVIAASQDWTLRDITTISVGGLHPRIFLLARR